MLWCVLCVGLVLLTLLTVWLTLHQIEYCYCAYIKRQIPFVASVGALRHAVAAEIVTKYPNAKTLCDIGSGYGGFARFLARKTGARVFALENMPFTFAVAYVLNLFCWPKIRNIRCDAFEYLRKCDVWFDVGIAYLGPGVNDKLVHVLDKFGVLIVLDVPISGLKPLYVVDVGHGYTKYGRRKFPHKLFVYRGKSSRN